MCGTPSSCERAYIQAASSHECALSVGVSQAGCGTDRAQIRCQQHRGGVQVLVGEDRHDAAARGEDRGDLLEEVAAGVDLAAELVVGVLAVPVATSAATGRISSTRALLPSGEGRQAAGVSRAGLRSSARGRGEEGRGGGVAHSPIASTPSTLSSPSPSVSASRMLPQIRTPNSSANLVPTSPPSPPPPPPPSWSM